MKFDLHGFYHILCTTIIPSIERDLFEGITFSKMGISIKEPTSSSGLIRITFPATKEKQLLLILRYLEKVPNLQCRLLLYGKTILITEEEAFREERERVVEVINDFLFEIGRRVEDFEVNFTLLTPLTIAVTQNPVHLRLYASSPGGALRLYQQTDASWQPRLEKRRILSINVPVKAMDLYAKGQFFLRRPKEIKEVEGDLNSSNEFSKVIPFEREYGHKITFLPLSFLTQQEQDILLLICTQLSTVEIGQKLGFETEVVESCQKELLSKINAKNVAGLVVYAIKTGLFRLDHESTCNLGGVKAIS